MRYLFALFALFALVGCTSETVVRTPTPVGTPIVAPITGGTYTYCDPNWPLFGIIGAIIFAVVLGIGVIAIWYQLNESGISRDRGELSLMRSENSRLRSELDRLEKAREPGKVDIELENERLRKLVDTLTRLVEQKGSA